MWSQSFPVTEEDLPYFLPAAHDDWTEARQSPLGALLVVRSSLAW